jgi:hypothetical protein
MQYYYTIIYRDFEYFVNANGLPPINYSQVEKEAISVHLMNLSSIPIEFRLGVLFIFHVRYKDMKDDTAKYH